MEPEDLNVIVEILREVAKSGPLALILFVLLREQMSKFDKFLNVLSSMEKALAGNTTAVENLSRQCAGTQAEIKQRETIENLRRELAKSRSESGGGGMGDERDND
jgi:hypothetical protein